MMSIDKRILLEKIAHLKSDLGLPLEFSLGILLVSGPAHLDTDLAVSEVELAQEENRL